MAFRATLLKWFKQLPPRWHYELFYQSGRALGVQGYQINGASGSFIGALFDQSVIRIYLEKGDWSPHLVDLLMNFFRERGGTFYDIGANIGLISIPVARNAEVMVMAFEPDPQNFALLKANAAMAGITMTSVNAAVGAEQGTLRFARSAYNAGDHRIAADGEIEVPAVRLDEFVPHRFPFAVKIDTQGAEPLIFAGGARVLAQADLIVTEFWPWGMRRMGLSAEAILSFALAHFPRGLILHHDQPPTRPEPIHDVVAKLRQVISAGGEFDQVDLVLTR